MLAQQQHLMAIGHIAKRAQQLPNIINIYQRLKGSSTRAQFGNVLALDLFASHAAQILKRVRHYFTLQSVQQSQLYLIVVVVDKALLAQPYGSRWEDEKCIG